MVTEAKIILIKSITMKIDHNNIDNTTNNQNIDRNKKFKQKLIKSLNKSSIRFYIIWNNKIFQVWNDYLCSFIKKYINQWWDGLVPSTYRFLDALGRVISILSKIYVTLTWHPKRDELVNPKAKSNKSYYSSFAVGSY